MVENEKQKHMKETGDQLINMLSSLVVTASMLKDAAETINSSIAILEEWIEKITEIDVESIKNRFRDEG